MTVAVCIHCGKLKFGALVDCPCCNFRPHLKDDKVKSVILTDHHFTEEMLMAFGQRIESGEILEFDLKTMQHFDEAFELYNSLGFDKPKGEVELKKSWWKFW